MVIRCGCSSLIVTVFTDAFYRILHMPMLNWYAVRGARVFDEFGACLIRHTVPLFPSISGRRRLYVEVIKRMLCFIRTCLMCDNQFVNFVAKYAVWYGRMMSPLGRNTLHCCYQYGVAVDDLWSLTPACIFKAVKSRFDISQVCRLLLVWYLNLFLFDLDTLDLVTLTATGSGGCDSVPVYVLTVLFKATPTIVGEAFIFYLWTF